MSLIFYLLSFKDWEIILRTYGLKKAILRYFIIFSYMKDRQNCDEFFISSAIFIFHLNLQIIFVFWYLQIYDSWGFASVANFLIWAEKSLKMVGCILVAML